MGQAATGSTPTTGTAPSWAATGSAGVDYGLAIDDSAIDGDFSPDWGEFADSHIYQVTVTGTGAPITAQFHDSEYDNGNSGSLTLEIWGPP